MIPRSRTESGTTNPAEASQTPPQQQEKSRARHPGSSSNLSYRRRARRDWPPSPGSRIEQATAQQEGLPEREGAAVPRRRRGSGAGGMRETLGRASVFVRRRRRRARFRRAGARGGNKGGGKGKKVTGGSQEEEGGGGCGPRATWWGGRGPSDASAVRGRTAWMESPGHAQGFPPLPLLIGGGFFWEWQRVFALGAKRGVCIMRVC